MKTLRSRALVSILALWACSAAYAENFSVTLLGSGENFPQPGRLGPSILVQAEGRSYIFDAGRGVLQRMADVGVIRQPIDAVFFTHLHSDHVIGFPGLWLGGWLFSGRDTPWQIFGPAGTRNMVEHLRQAYDFDISIRIKDDRASPDGIAANVTEVEDGWVWHDGEVTVRAIEVDHAPVKPAFGYRIDVGDYSVALSGDTRYSPHFIEAARGADLVIHEVSDASPEFLAANPSFRDIVRAHHTTAEQAGRVFTQVAPKLAVFAHMVTRDITFEQLVQMTRKTYDGPLIVGQDLMRFDIGDEIAVVPPP